MTAPATTGSIRVILHPGDSLTRAQRLVYVFVLGALTALGPFTIDLYLPAFPSLKEQFGVTDGAVQLTLTATTLGFAAGQLLVGPWSDKVGRRLPLIIATTVHIAASIGAATAPDIELLGLFRVLQGMGAAAGGVVAMATVRDLFGGKPLVRMLSRLAMVNGLAPILAPLIGSQMLRFTSWRGIFVFLACYGLAVVIASILLIVETLPPARRQEAGHSTMRQRYRALFSDRIFVGVALIGAMVFSGLFSYLSASPFLFQGVYGLNAQQYGLLFAVNSVGVVLGVQISARLAQRVGPQWILACSTATLFLASVGDHRARPARCRARRGPRPAVVLHRGVRVLVPARAGHRSGVPRQRGRDGGVGARRAELRRRRAHLADRRLARDHAGGTHGRR